MKITFLSSNSIAAVKRFTDSGVRSYPLIKAFTSHTFDLEKSNDGLREKLRLMQDFATQGACLLKGNTTRQLTNESRRNTTAKDELTSNVIFDIDGIFIDGVNITPPLDKAMLESIADIIVSELPTPFQKVSYLCHASSSMGMKKNKVSLHLDFWINEPVHPTQLKDYLTNLNFTIPLFERQLDLSASGSALRFPLDRCLADNSRLIYIAPPDFEGSVIDPIPQRDDRIFLVRKTEVAVDLRDELNNLPKHATIQKRIKDKVSELRSVQGLPDKKDRVQTLKIDGFTTAVVTNPDAVKMTIVEDRDPWITYNVNNGDSGAYYVDKYNPIVVYNFKGEPNFLFEAADPAAYQAHLERFVFDNPNNEQMNIMIPMVFRDYKSSAYYNALINAGKGQIETIAKAPREALPDFMAQYGGVMPENVPIWRYEFHPKSDVAVDYESKFINKYVPSEYMRTNPDMPTDYEPLEYGNSYKLGDICPKIFTLIYHVLGNGMEEFLHFLNWLAAAFQTREKLGTAWILQGVQGTGKGQLFERIIGPLVGAGVDDNYPYFIKLRQENIEDQFNQWEETALFAAFDEFRLNDSPQAHKLFNKIKLMISDEENTVRGMRENTRRVKLYTNFLLFSNDEDMIPIPADDRRLNVGIRQNQKLEKAFKHDLDTVLRVHIPAELPYFARILREFKVDMAKAREPLDNLAKRQVRIASATSIDEFVEAFKKGDLEYFLSIFDMVVGAPGSDYVGPAKLIVKKALLDYKDDEKEIQKITVDQLRILYCALVSKSDNAKKFGKLMHRHGLPSKQLRFGALRKQGFEVHWYLREQNIDDLLEEYIPTNAPEFKTDNVRKFKPPGS